MPRKCHDLPCRCSPPRSGCLPGLWWNNTDYLRLVEWMRAYNVRHPGDPVRFIGDDIAWTGPELYDAVTDHVAATRPELSPRFAELYRGLRPTVATKAYIEQYLSKPHAERGEMAERTGAALDLLRSQGAGEDRAAYERAVQNATVIDQTARQYAFDFEDPAQIAEAMRYRDGAMAANVLVSVGVTFGRGSFNATGLDEEAIRSWTLGPAGPGSNERTLDRVRHRDYVVDLRSVGSPAREWLAKARPTRTIGTAYPDGPNDIALSRSHDVLIHLQEVEASILRDV
ncbi:erythromycin esterase family protein [Streptomyces sp. 4N124]|uniref:erythromycin esterase family protein n=1 Tax=Streptomyces sp. 4N124 TaxID=3457420 RepID=UPI003FD67A8A